MNLRYVVPALGALAFIAAPATAADLGKGLSLSGWADTTFTIGDNNTSDVSGTARKESSPGQGFYAEGSIKVGWQVTDAVKAKINLWFSPDVAPAQLRESYFAWSFNPDWTWTMGKYIDHLGWIAAEPTGLYRINNSTIGYLALYGNDVVGTAISYAEKDSPFSASFHVVNGYFTAEDAYSRIYTTNSFGRENRDLGFGLDLVWTKGPVSVNLEAAYDVHSTNAFPFTLGAGTPANGLGGSVAVVGLNTTIKPVDPLTLGAEIMYGMKAKDKLANKTTVDGTKATRLQGLLSATYALQGTGIPMALTGQVQAISQKGDVVGGGSKPKSDAVELSVALLTNPVKDTNFGLNYELAYSTTKTKYIALAPGAKDKVNAIQFAVEGLIVIP